MKQTYYTVSLTNLKVSARAIVLLTLLILSICSLTNMIEPAQAEFTRIGVLTPGEDLFSSAVIDAAGGFAYFGTWTTPGMVVRIRLSDFTYAGTITLNPGEGYLRSPLIDSDNGFAYFVVDDYPCKVVKIDLSTFTRVDPLTLSNDELFRCAVIDVANGFAYFGSWSSPKVVKVSLSDFAIADTLPLNSGEDHLHVAVIDAAGGFAYFGNNALSGKIVKIDLSTFTRVGALNLNPGEDSLVSSVIDVAGGFAYFGTWTAPGKIVKVKLSDFTCAGALTLNPGEDNLASAVIDVAGGFAYFGVYTYTSPGKIVRIDLSTFTHDVLTLNPGEDHLSAAIIDASGGFAYFGTTTSPGKIVKIDNARARAFIIDPIGDQIDWTTIQPTTGMPYGDITYSSITSTVNNVRFQLNLEGDVPAAPPMDAENDGVQYFWYLDTDRDPNTGYFESRFTDGIGVDYYVYVRCLLSQSGTWKASLVHVIGSGLNIQYEEILDLSTSVSRDGKILTVDVPSSQLEGFTSFYWIVLALEQRGGHGIGDLAPGEIPPNISHAIFEFPMTQPPTVSLSSAWKVNEVTIDGQMTDSSEWSEAQSKDLTIQEYHEDNTYGSETLPATCWFKNDGNSLFMLLRIQYSEADPAGDVATISYIWNNYQQSDSGGSWAGQSWDGSGWEGLSGHPFTWHSDLEYPGGQNNVEAAAYNDGTYYWVEIKTTLDSGDGYDWSLTPGQTYGNDPDWLGIALTDQSANTVYARQITLTLASSPPPAPQPVSLSSAWKVNDVTVDGQITGSEWSEVQPVDVTLYNFDFSQNVYTTDTTPSTFWIKNDGEWLYQLVKVPWNQLDVDLDYDGATMTYYWNNWASSDSGSSAGGDLYGWVPGTSFAIMKNDVMDGGGQNNVVGAATFDGTYYWFEYKKALNSGDGCDWTLTPGQTYGGDPDALSIGVFDASKTEWHGRTAILKLVTNTPEGSSVVVEPEDTSTGTNPVDLSFSTVTQEGVTSLTTSQTGSEPPSGFVLGDPPTYYELTTTAVYSGPIQTCIDYSGVSYLDESNLRIFHYEDTNEDGNPDTWVDRTVSLDTTNKIICASVTSLSPFAIFELDNTPPTVTITVPEAWGIYSAASGATYQFSANDNLGNTPTVTATQTDYAGQSISITNGGLLPMTSGVYTLTVTATDNAGNPATASVIFVIYDPNAGFVTGGGWIVPEPELGNNRATFGFVAKYKVGSHTPDGNLEFQYKYRDINLKSNSIEWLTVSDNKAVFQGTATINGAGTYKFRVDATDGDLTGGKPDNFAIKIWLGNDVSTNPKYDYKGDLQGGSIIVHKK